MARKQVNTRALSKLSEARSIVKRNFRATAGEISRFIDELDAAMSSGGRFAINHDGTRYEVDPMRVRIHKTRVDFGTTPALALHLGSIDQGDEPGEYTSWQDAADGLRERITLSIVRDTTISDRFMKAA